jgi:manganese/zinc/iron transport system permease protein
MVDYLLALITDPTLMAVALGTTLIGVTAGLLGCFTLLQRKSMIGDGVAHAILPGVVIAFIFTGHKDPATLFVGSVIAGWISLWAMEVITRRTGLSPETGVGIVLSVFFGLGVMLLGWVQGQQTGTQSGLDHFLFGQAAAMTLDDVRFLSLVSLLVLAYVALSFYGLRLRAFDPWYARSLGVDAPWQRYLENSVFVVVLTTGLQAVGVVLMSAVLILPAAIARYWTDRMPTMMAIAALMAALAAQMGSGISYMSPQMPTGPWMVVVAALMLFLSMALAPRYGFGSMYLRRRRQKQLIDEEHLLKTMWTLEIASKKDVVKEVKKAVAKEVEKVYDRAIDRMEPGFLASSPTTSSSTTHPPTPGVTLLGLVRERPADAATLPRTLKRLLRKGYLQVDQGPTGIYPGPAGVTLQERWSLTEAGRDEARRLVRVHRLWETYLTELMRIAETHVHRDADWMEHLITPEVEQQLAAKLGYPALDPHRQIIPYDTQEAR